MQHLQFDINKTLDNKQRKLFTDFVELNFSKIMNTGSSHVAISIREFPRNALKLGRSKNNDYVCLMNLDIRNGRSEDQKRKLAIIYMEGVEKILSIKKQNQYLTFTSHQGNDFNLIERSLEDWIPNDKPLG